MKKMLLFFVLALSVIGSTAQWKKLNAGSIESGISGDPTLRFGFATGFGANGDDAIAISNESLWKINNNGVGTAVVLTTLPTGVSGGSKVNGILKGSDGLFYVWGFFPVNATQYYGVMVSNSSNPTSFSVLPTTLSTYQFGSNPAQRGVVCFSEYSYGVPVAQPGFIIYSPDFISLNGTAVPSTVAFMTLAGVVTDLPQFKPNTEQRIIPTYPVTNPRILFMVKRINSSSTNGHLLVGGRFQTLGGVSYNGLVSYDNVTSTFTNFNVTNSSGNQAVTQYNPPAGKEYVTWKSDNQPTNGGISSSGLLEINSSNTLVGVSGGVSNLQSNCSINFDGKTWIGGSRFTSTLPANCFYYDGSTFTDGSGVSPNDLDANGAETFYDLFATPNFLYGTGNFQTSLGDVANYIAVRKLAPPLALLFKTFRGELQNNSAKIYFEIHADASVEIQQSSDGINFSSVTTISVLKNVLITQSLPILGSNIIYVRLKSKNEYSQTLVLRKSDSGIIKVFKNGNGIVVTTPTKANYAIVDLSGRILQKGTLERGVTVLQIPSTIRGMVFVNIQTNSEKKTDRIVF